MHGYEFNGVVLVMVRWSVHRGTLNKRRACPHGYHCVSKVYLVHCLLVVQRGCGAKAGCTCIVLEHGLWTV